MREVIAVEALKMRRSPVVLVASVLIVVLVPLIALGFVIAAGLERTGAIALKAQAMVRGEGWVAYLDLLGQMMAITLFIGPGVVAAWVFGREFSDRTFPSLFALPVGRDSIAIAKFIVFLAWGFVLLVAVTLAAVVVGFVTNVGPVADVDLVGGVARLVVAGALTVMLAATIAVPASVGRGYLPAIGAIVLITLVAQVAVVFGSGGWFPFAAPGLFAVAGVDDSIHVGVPELLLVPVTALAAAWFTVRFWRDAEVG